MRSYIDFSSTRPRLLVAFGAGFLIALLLPLLRAIAAAIV